MVRLQTDYIRKSFNFTKKRYSILFYFIHWSIQLLIAFNDPVSLYYYIWCFDPTGKIWFYTMLNMYIKYKNQQAVHTTVLMELTVLQNSKTFINIWIVRSAWGLLYHTFFPKLQKFTQVKHLQHFKSMCE